MVVGCALIWFVQQNHIAGTPVAHPELNLVDLDGDGDLDAIFTLEGDSSTLWINQGGLQGNIPGKFIASLQQIGQQDARYATSGDLDGDGDPDILIVTDGGFEFYVNSGGPQGGWKGNFELHSQVELSKTTADPYQIQLGDLDNDGDLDAISTACCQHGNGFSVWMNDGAGNFSQLGQYAENLEIRQAILGDLDGDLDLDVWIVPTNQEQAPEGKESNFSDQLWINDGDGHFHDRGDRLGYSQVISLGDLDGDRDLDASAATQTGLSIWINDGAGYFDRRTEKASPLSAQTMLLEDLDQDDDLDILIFSADQGEVWLNDGWGNFERSAQRIALPGNSALALGDLDGDGDPDLFCGFPENRYRVWWNDGYGRLGLSWR